MIIGMQENNVHERGKGEGGSKSISPQPPCNAVSLVSRSSFFFISLFPLVNIFRLSGQVKCIVFLKQSIHTNTNYAMFNLHRGFGGKEF